MLFYSLLIFGVTARLLPHPANFTPIAALALFGGYNLSRREALFLPLLVAFISDIFISGYYGQTMLYVYGSYLVIFLIGQLVKGRPLWLLAPAAFISSGSFFLISNFGAWLDPLMGYTRNWPGLVSCYTAAIPFFRNTLTGDLFYTGVIFGAVASARAGVIRKYGSYLMSLLISRK